MKNSQIKKIAGKLTASLAYGIASVSANTACAWLGYQPKLPESVRRMKKS